MGGEESPAGEGRRGGIFLGREEDELLEGETDEGRRMELMDKAKVDELRSLTSVAASAWDENESL